MNPDFLEILPAPSYLAPCVRRFLYANRTIDAPVPMNPKPSGYVYFSNFFSSNPVSFSFEIEKMGKVVPGRWNMAGQIEDDKIQGWAADEIRVLFCELSPTAIYRLYHQNSEPLTGVAGEMRDLLPGSETALRESFTLDETAACHEHVNEAISYFTQLLANARDGDAAVEYAVEQFEMANGAIKVETICRELDISQRQFIRRFKRIVGVSPKFFGQVLQINWALGLLYFGNVDTLGDVAQEAGFFDQAHFIHAMQRFFNESPNAFLKSDYVDLKTFLATSRFKDQATA
ncbi:MAG: helix-turn-helix domain-containing protein [Nitrospirales bacterium]